MAAQVKGHFIPTVDISTILSPTASEGEQREAVECFTQAATTYGFFNLVGHGIPTGLLRDVFESSKLFFSLSEDKRNEGHVGKALGRSFRGYEPPFIQKHDKDLLPDTKETFIIGREIPADHPEAGTFLTGPNLWPDLPEGKFRDVVLAYQAKMVELAGIIIRTLVRGLPKEWGCPPDALDNLLVQDSRQFGVAAHTDSSAITILLQQPGTEGLEVWYPPISDWIPVPVVEDGFVVNIGDLLQKYTGGCFRSARHRVVTRGEKDKHRYSVAFFLDGNLQFKSRQLDGTGEETAVGEYVRSCLDRTMGSRGPLL
ncbi:putative 1-aminocyclopropane-1-carboxylate oxidase [Xylariaceae sp. FL0594]|nr:putative 1-aminocyclopropane-1-carboxylate oxidase [Xylariaceae sp. FL0594]